MNLIRGTIRHLFEILKKFSGGYIVPLSRGGPVPTWGEGEGLTGPYYTTLENYS